MEAVAFATNIPTTKTMKGKPTEAKRRSVA